MRSSPARGTWVEIVLLPVRLNRLSRRLPHGGRGLKFFNRLEEKKTRSRLPHGGRGLKLYCLFEGRITHRVVSRTGDVG